VTGIRLCMTVTDPDTPDPMNDPRTTQADPGAYAQGADLASTEDEPAAAGDEELAVGEEELAVGEEDLAAGATTAGTPGGGDAAGGGLPVEGGIPSSGGAEPEPEVETGAPFTQIAPPA
jgi:hypothetical protein